MLSCLGRRQALQVKADVKTQGATTENVNAIASLRSNLRVTMQESLFSFLWTPSRRRFSTVSWSGDADATGRLADSSETLASSELRLQAVWAGRGVKIERHPSQTSQRGAFATVFYGIIQDEGEGSRLVGHFQIHPVGRLFVAAWILLSTLLALALILAGALRATPESTAQDALPFLFPVLLPFLGLGLAHWLRRRGRPDEAAIRGWLDSLKNDYGNQD